MSDEVYRERARLVAFLAAQYPSVLHYSDPNEPEWPVVYITAPSGQMSWHVSQHDLDLFEHVPWKPRQHKSPWDGHDTETKYERLAELTREVTNR